MLVRAKASRIGIASFNQQVDVLKRKYHWSNSWFEVMKRFQQLVATWRSSFVAMGPYKISTFVVTRLLYDAVVLLATRQGFMAQRTLKYI
jgi:hypothetical protein